MFKRNRIAALSIAADAIRYFCTYEPLGNWEDMCFEQELVYEKFKGYKVVIFGETCEGCPNYLSVHILDAGKTDEPDDVTEVQYTHDDNEQMLANHIYNALNDLEYIVDVVIPGKEDKKPRKSRAKFHKGGHILSMDEFVKQEFVFLNDKITHRGWFMSWQIRMVYSMLGENGHIYYAVKDAKDKIVCENCGKKFANGGELKKFVEIRRAADDVYVIDYRPEIDLDDNCQVFNGCPNCRTDAYLKDLEE